MFPPCTSLLYGALHFSDLQLVVQNYSSQQFQSFFCLYSAFKASPTSYQKKKVLPPPLLRNSTATAFPNYAPCFILGHTFILHCYITPTLILIMHSLLSLTIFSFLPHFFGFSI